MKTYKLDTFTKGWFIGDFSNSILRTKEFETAIKFYKAGNKENRHIHYISTEITIIISGKVKMNEITYYAGDIIEISPGESTDFECLDDAVTCCVKTPSSIGDKYDLDQS
jgi:mannose-6-phosphate isomerase-like protein (cupin superfamily)